MAAARFVLYNFCYRASTIGSALLGRPLEGVWHTGIEVFGKEHFFSKNEAAQVPVSPIVFF